jgi:hypothetical protein
VHIAIDADMPLLPPPPQKEKKKERKKHTHHQYCYFNIKVN